MSESKEQLESKARRDGNKEEKKLQIRRAAYQCFRESGYHATTMDAICKHAGISKGSFYWHYDSKQEVFIDILEAWGREVMGEIFTQFETSLEREDDVIAIAHALKREAHRGRAIVPLWLEFTLQARTDATIQKAISRFYRRARAAIAELLRPHIRHLFSDEEIDGLSASIFGGFMGLMIQELVDPSGANAEAAIEQFMEAFERAVRSPSV